jgi:hypothetical protein
MPEAIGRCSRRSKLLPSLVTTEIAPSRIGYTPTEGREGIASGQAFLQLPIQLPLGVKSTELSGPGTATAAAFDVIAPEPPGGLQAEEKHLYRTKAVGRHQLQAVAPPLSGLILGKMLQQGKDLLVAEGHTIRLAG